jgi:hypothetical protein
LTVASEGKRHTFESCRARQSGRAKPNSRICEALVDHLPMFNNVRFVLWHMFSQSLEYSSQFRRVKRARCDLFEKSRMYFSRKTMLVNVKVKIFADPPRCTRPAAPSDRFKQLGVQKRAISYKIVE